MNMFADHVAKDIDSYFAAVPDDRKEAFTFVDQLIKDNAPTLTPYFATNMLGYGQFNYLDSKKKSQTWPVIALANQKNYISLYVCAVQDGEYLAEKYVDELGNVSIGRSCIRFKKLEDINVEGFKKVIAAAAKSPGFVS